MEQKITKRFSDIRANGLEEWICEHGVGHHQGRHGCCGCCSKEENKKIMEQTTKE